MTVPHLNCSLKKIKKIKNHTHDCPPPELFFRTSSGCTCSPPLLSWVWMSECLHIELAQPICQNAIFTTNHHSSTTNTVKIKTRKTFVISFEYYLTPFVEGTCMFCCCPISYKIWRPETRDQKTGLHHQSLVTGRALSPILRLKQSARDSSTFSCNKISKVQ